MLRSLFGAAALASAVVAYSAPAAAQMERVPDRPAGEGEGPYDTLLIKGATMIDGTGAPPEGPVSILVEGIRIARRIARTEPAASCITDEFTPGWDMPDDDYDALLNWARDTATTIYHPTGTCKMGSDPMAVVDARLRVKGVEGLRVADASIMPVIVSGNTNAPTMMIGEKASDMILEDARRAVANMRRNHIEATTA